MTTEQKEALVLLESVDDSTDMEEFCLSCDNELLMEAYFSGASGKADFIAYVMGEKDSFDCDESTSVYKSSSPTKTKNREYRMRCNVCGQVFCYTDADIKENKSHRNMAALNAVGSMFSPMLYGYAQLNQSQRERDKIVDYTRCPNCKSTNLIDISNEPLDVATPKNVPEQAQQATTTVAEELKQLKELLDMDIITQEEFNAKKKQLLGL